MSNLQTPPEHFLQLGSLGKTFQLSGGLRFYALGEAETEAIGHVQEVFVSSLGKRQVKDVRVVGQNIIIYLQGITNIDKAKALVNQNVYAHQDAIPKLESDDFYVDDLIDSGVFLDGEPLGRVSELIEAGPTDLVVVQTATGTLMIPLQADYVRLEDDGIYIDQPPEGLLELNA